MPPSQNPQQPTGYPAPNSPAGPPNPAQQLNSQLPQQFGGFAQPIAQRPSQPMQQQASVPAPQPSQQYNQQPQPVQFGQQYQTPQQPVYTGGGVQGQQQPNYQQPAYPAQQPQASQPLQPMQRPAPTPQGSPDNRYDFFMQPQPTSKPIGGFTAPSSFAKIIIGAVLLFVVMGIVAVILSASSGNKNSPLTGITELGRQQQEIIRISTLGAQQIQAQGLKNFAVTATLTTTTAQQQLVDFAAKNGVTLSEDSLKAGANTNTDKILDAAKSANTYDTTFQSTMQGLLTEYQNKAQQTRDASTTQAARDTLDADLKSALLLTQMLGQL